MRRRAGNAALVLLFVAGCTNNGIRMAPVSGTVTMNGRPLPNVYVNFQPVGSDTNPNPGRGSYGVTDSQGKYTLVVDAQTRGAVVGRHRVTIATRYAEDAPVDPRKGSPDGAPPRLSHRESVPTRYNQQSTLVFDVPAKGSSAADFDLTSP
jgi:hypothetical protein